MALDPGQTGGNQESSIIRSVTGENLLISFEIEE